MSKNNKRITEEKNLNNRQFSISNNSKIKSNISKKNIKHSFDIDTIEGTEAYYSNRYGWTLRKT